MELALGRWIILQNLSDKCYNFFSVATKIFVNLSVKDLKQSTEFFTKLGYTFNPQFTDQNATCMVIDEAAGIYAMLLIEPFFKSFIPNFEIADASKTKEVLTALSCESREAVDEMMKKALDAGAKEHVKHQPEGAEDFMYGRAYQDLDGHIWELVYMDLSKAPPSPQG